MPAHRYAGGILHPNYQHGYGKTLLAGVWREMKRRCSDSNVSGFANYGGNGISVCDEWLDFMSFREWSMSNGYHEGLSIDRIDPSGNYCPENCRWVTRVIQNRNKNTYKRNKTGHSGVLWRKQNRKWQAKISIEGKTKHIGLFSTMDEAIKARERAEIEYWGFNSPRNRDMQGG